MQGTVQPKRAMLAAMRATRPGMFEYEIAAVIEGTFLRHGTGPGYTSIVGAGANASSRDAMARALLVELIVQGAVILESGKLRVVDPLPQPHRLLTQALRVIGDEALTPAATIRKMPATGGRPVEAVMRSMAEMSVPAGSDSGAR